MLSSMFIEEAHKCSAHAIEFYVRSRFGFDSPKLIISKDLIF